MELQEFPPIRLHCLPKSVEKNLANMWNKSHYALNKGWDLTMQNNLHNSRYKINDARHEKTDLKVFVVVIPLEGTWFSNTHNLWCQQSQILKSWCHTLRSIFSWRASNDKGNISEEWEIFSKQFWRNVISKHIFIMLQNIIVAAFEKVVMFGLFIITVYEYRYRDIFIHNLIYY